MNPRLPQTNIENDALYGVKKIYACKQSSETTLGKCYGYSMSWGLHGDTFLLIPHAVDNDNTNELPLTDEIASFQLLQFMSKNADRHLHFYFFTNGLLKLIDKATKELTSGNTIILNASLSIGAHALSFKRMEDDTIMFFDCNRGKYKAPSVEAFKNWLPNYLRINYANAFYLYTYDEVKTDKNHVRTAKNLFKSIGFVLGRLFMFPLGLPGIFRFVIKLAKNIWHHLGKGSTHNKYQESQQQKIPTTYGTFHNMGLADSAKRVVTDGKQEENPAPITIVKVKEKGFLTMPANTAPLLKRM